MPAIFGKQTVGASDYTTAKGVTCRFTAPEGGIAIAIGAHIKSTGTANFKLICHADNSGQPQALLGETAGASFNTTYAWYELPIITPFSFAANAVLHPGVISDDFIIIPYDAGGSTGQFKEILPEFAYPTPSDPASVNPGAEFDVIASLYIKYKTEAETHKVFVRTGIRPALFKPGNSR